jgi:hypothetical protein
MPTLRVALVLYASAVGAAGCGGARGNAGGSSPPAPAAPAAPAAATMTMDLSITSGGLNLDDMASGKGLFAPANNHLQASSYVLVVNDTLASPLALPVALLGAANAAAGQLSAQSAWVRSYDATVGGRKWTTNLSSTENSDQSIDWSLRVTAMPLDSGGCCTDFEIASGSSRGGGAGAWTINDIGHPTAALPLFSVAYTVRSREDKSLVFTVSDLKPAALRFGGGSTLSYAVAGDEVTMLYQDAADGESRTIAWRRSSQAGSYIDPLGQKVCWQGKDMGYVNGSCD